MLSQKKLAGKRRRKRLKRKKVLAKKNSDKTLIVEKLKQAGLLSENKEENEKIMNHILKIKKE